MSSPVDHESPTDSDDWDHHWNSYGEAADTNPANVYRRNLILRLLGELPAGSALLDIGSGQGAFVAAFKTDHPHVDVWGVENSAEGVSRARATAQASGLDVHFIQRDLLETVEREPDQPPAGFAVCSEVLEHVGEPSALMRNAVSLLSPGARVVVTVPGGPRSAFDRHIGHRRHFDAASLRQTLIDAGLEVDRVLRAGFPGFNVYKLAVILRGKRLIQDVESTEPGASPSRSATLIARVFSTLFTLNREDAPFGWQLAAVAHVPLVEA